MGEKAFAEHVGGFDNLKNVTLEQALTSCTGGKCDTTDFEDHVDKVKCFEKIEQALEKKNIVAIFMDNGNSCCITQAKMYGDQRMVKIADPTEREAELEINVDAVWKKFSKMIIVNDK